MVKLQDCKCFHQALYMKISKDLQVAWQNYKITSSFFIYRSSVNENLHGFTSDVIKLQDYKFWSSLVHGNSMNLVKLKITL